MTSNDNAKKSGWYSVPPIKLTNSKGDSVGKVYQRDGFPPYYFKAMNASRYASKCPPGLMIDCEPLTLALEAGAKMALVLDTETSTYWAFDIAQRLLTAPKQWLKGSRRVGIAFALCHSSMDEHGVLALRQCCEEATIA